jgi:3-hydroxyisobutyrate dehydrogenase-like beta-hydroxyacid dehydrogenase
MVWNRSPAKVEPLVDLGAETRPSPAETVAGRDVIITMLSDRRALEDVLFGPAGAMESMRGDELLIEMSTVGPDTIQRVEARLPRGVTLVDAPVRGSVPQATDGSLTILVGADEDTFTRVADLLEPVGTCLHVGPQGAGAAMKLVVNLTLGTTLTLLGEALALSRALGLDPVTTWDVLEASPIGHIAKGKRSKIEGNSYDPMFSLDLASKDLELVRAAAEQAGLELKLTEACRAWFEEAQRNGWGDRDFTSIVAAIRDRVNESPST